MSQKNILCHFGVSLAYFRILKIQLITFIPQVAKLTIENIKINYLCHSFTLNSRDIFLVLKEDL